MSWLLIMLLTLISMTCAAPSVIYIMDYGLKEMRIKDVVCLVLFLPGAIIVFIIGGIARLLVNADTVLDRKVFKQDK